MHPIEDAENACGSTPSNGILNFLDSVRWPSRPPHRQSLTVLFVMAWLAGFFSEHFLSAAEIPSAVLIKVEDNKTPEVVPFYRPVSPTRITDRGLLVWSEGAQEYWQPCPVQDVDRFEPQALLVGSRGGAFGSGENNQAGDALAMATMQIDQIRFLPRFKGKGFITPAQQGRLLDPRVTIRRQPRITQPEYPAVTVELLRRGQVLFEFPLKEGQNTIRWGEIGWLPESLKNGLSPGEYVFRVKGGSETASFVVEDVELRESVWDFPGRLRKLLGTKNDSLYLQVAVEHLLAQTDDRGAPQPYLADALDLLEDAPAETLTPFLNRLRNDILARLDADPSSGDPAADFDDPTGVPAIDQARMLIAAGKWGEARAKLASPEGLETPRSQALSTLYQAVILSESAQAMEEETRAHFRIAISQLADGQPSDAYRAHNNYANFLLCRAQDRLYNQAFEVASGVPNSLIHSLLHWREALEHYTIAGKIAEQLDEERQATVRVNVARTYALLADVIRTLDAPVSGKRRFAAQEDAVHDYAADLARKVVECGGEEVHSLTQAAAHEVLAHIAYRKDDWDACRQHAGKSLSVYTESGSLPGVAGIHRVLGLLDLRSAATVDSDSATAKQPEAALRHFQVAHFLSEFLRQRIAEDNIGLTRAGYLARHAYLNEQIVGLLIEQGKDVEALQFAELAKARALRDVLCGAQVSSNRNSLGAAVLQEMLTDWPDGIVALEYYLGSERAWLFLIGGKKDVRSFVLTNREGEAVQPRDLILRIHRFLTSLDIDTFGRNYGTRMYLSSQYAGFDHTWQDELHELYEVLIPTEARQELDKAKRVLVVPHHILHYFPFAALVTERDERPRGKKEVIRPQFLIDRGFSICNVPSLTTWSGLRQKMARPVRSAQAIGIVDFPRANRLPGVATDLANLRQIFGASVKEVLENSEVTDSRTKTLLRHPGLMLAATHGENKSHAPLESYLLVLNGEGTAEKRLTAREIYEAPVGADVVVMSACYSGLARQSPLPGDDLFGLQRALLHSGARSVVSGLWDVHDKMGPVVLKQFMKNFAEGEPLPDALADAQRMFLAKERESFAFALHPYFWAVFVTTGDDRTCFMK